MTDGAPSEGDDEVGAEADDEDRWLLARERGEPTPPLPAATAARYAQLQSLIEDLPAVPAGVALRPDWQQSVLDAIDRGDDAERIAAGTAREHVPAAPDPDVRPIHTARPKRTSTRRRTAIVVSCLAVAAGAAFVLTRPPRRPTAELTISALATGGPMLAGSGELRAGGTAVAHGVIDGPGELRVYDANDIELARCTATAPGCIVARTGKRTELRIELVLPATGALHVVLLSAPLPGPSGGRARDLEAADRKAIAVTRLDAMVR